MALADNKRLYDIATRKAVYVEGVKLAQAHEFNKVLAHLKEELDKLLRRIKYKTLDGLTKAELSRLVISLRAIQSSIYSDYTEKLIDDLQAFMSANLEVSRRSYAKGRIELDRYSEEDDVELSDDEAIAIIDRTVENESDIIPLFGLLAVAGNDNKLWSVIKNAPIPANGIYITPFIKGFAVSAQASVENIIRKAYANGQSVEDTIAELTGETNAQGTSSQLQRISQQATAVIDTSYGHVAGVVDVAVSSALFRRYVWNSVMDGNTTHICRTRNLHVYHYGEGPVPPAHIRCRSHVSPIVGSDPVGPETFFAWIRRQPVEVQDDMLGNDGGSALRNGEMTAAMLKSFEASRPLTLAQFRRKVSLILKRG